MDILNPSQIETLELLAGAIQDAKAALDRAVIDLRDRGATWTEIGRALDITRQAAQQRFGTDLDASGHTPAR